VVDPSSIDVDIVVVALVAVVLFLRSEIVGIRSDTARCIVRTLGNLNDVRRSWNNGRRDDDGGGVLLSDDDDDDLAMVVDDIIPPPLLLLLALEDTNVSITNCARNPISLSILAKLTNSNKSLYPPCFMTNCCRSDG
jgi:hypothetical protein